MAIALGFGHYAEDYYFGLLTRTAGSIVRLIIVKMGNPYFKWYSQTAFLLAGLTSGQQERTKIKILDLTTLCLDHVERTSSLPCNAEIDLRRKW